MTLLGVAPIVAFMIIAPMIVLRGIRAATVDNTLASSSTVLASSLGGFAALVDPLDARLMAAGI